ncbi:beta-glucosidase [Capronia coronata CBS 617.96]|uniref:Beta-glucosidase n=1 Tax=Capronia coronata CBS 617.96 TaxID=1182541 RepID=W9YWU8_9EURO|nr:beta-glucosidase [Capronia coronata CBS 617.96]EXJ93761.1 beta-glucosidase [Capronia coronata CBS 617.96]
MFAPLIVVACATLGAAQQVYITTSGTVARPSCSAPQPWHGNPQPHYYQKPFSWTQTETVRYATSVPSPTSTTTYARPYEELSYLLGNVVSTTWGSWDRNASVRPTDTADPYGQAAWTAQWENANIVNWTTSTQLYSTTVSPTPVAASELVYPPPRYLNPTECYTFPEGFMLGVAGSASQFEGAVAMEGKAPMQQDNVGPESNHVANEYYFLYKQDIERLAAMGVKYFYFSISWARILPFALPGTPINMQAIQHYDDVINFVLEKGMIPVVTMWHLDTPLTFFEGNRSMINYVPPPGFGFHNGGFQNETFQDAFVNYGKILLTHYADRVPLWFTFNEPFLDSINGQSIYTVLKAHARLAHFYREEIHGTGMMGLKFIDNFGVAADPHNATSAAAAQWYNDFHLGAIANPLYLGIDYPETYKQAISDYVPLTPEDLAYMKQTADVFGIDPYTINVINPAPGGLEACLTNASHPLHPGCVTTSTLTQTGWAVGYGGFVWAHDTPKYLRTYLSYLWDTYRTPIIATEIGFPVSGEGELPLANQRFDSPRSDYLVSNLNEILKAIWEDGVQVLGAFVWSFADDWEMGTYASQFGLQFVNRTDQTRQYKRSFFDLMDFYNSRKSD